jgi:hypothetical protein
MNEMIPYISHPGSPPVPDRLESGRPPSRLEVQQYFLDHKRQRYLQLQNDGNQPSVIPFGNVIRSVRLSFGNLLIGLGSWLARETATSPDLLARR